MPKPPSVKRLQDEITSILDTSEHIKSNLASALEQSVYNDSHLAGEFTYANITVNRIVQVLYLCLRCSETSLIVCIATEFNLFV